MILTLLWTDIDPVRHRATQDLGHGLPHFIGYGLRVFARIQVKLGLLGILFQQALAFQSAACTLTDQRYQVLQLAFIQRPVVIEYLDITLVALSS